jgi:predicted nucleic acid-binding protein
MAERNLLDTNIFVYSFDASAPAKRHRAQQLISEGLRDGNGIVSWQVVQEFLNVALHRFRKPMSASAARAYLERVLWPMCAVLPDAGLFKGALEIREETGWSFYDALIMSAAIAGRCAVLLTEDLQDRRVVRGIEIRNPFKP